MAEDVLEDMDDFDDAIDDDAIDDILDDALEDSSNQTNAGRMKSLLEKAVLKVKGLFKKISVSKKTMIIIAASFFMLIILITGAVVFFSKTVSEDDLGVQHSIDTNDNMQTPAIPETEIIFKDIIDFEPFEFVRLKQGSKMESVSVTLSLELTDHRLRKQIYTMEDEIRDVITDQIEKMGWLELRNPGGKIMLKYNMLKRINSIFPKAAVRNIYFTYFIMQ